MSYNTFPTFAGKGWGIKKRPFWSTLSNDADSGAQYATQRYQFPLYEFDIEIPYMSQSDYTNLIGFFNQQGGRFQPFYFSADNDNTVTNQAFATLDTTTTVFQLTKSNGSYWSEPIGGVNGTPLIYANGTQILQSGTGTPAAPTLGQTAGGTKAARTYYVRIAYVSATGNTSASSSEVSLAVSANQLLTVAAPPSVTGSIAWLVFISTTSGTETLAATLAPGASYTEPTGTLPSGIAYTTTDLTPYSVSASGAVTLVGGGSAGVSLSWTGNYFYLVRFKDDHIEAEQFMSQMYDATTITLRTFR